MPNEFEAYDPLINEDACKDHQAARSERSPERMGRHSGNSLNQCRNHVPAMAH